LVCSPSDGDSQRTERNERPSADVAKNSSERLRDKKRPSVDGKPSKNGRPRDSVSGNRGGQRNGIQLKTPGAVSLTTLVCSPSDGDSQRTERNGRPSADVAKNSSERLRDNKKPSVDGKPNKSERLSGGGKPNKSKRLTDGDSGNGSGPRNQKKMIGGQFSKFHRLQVRRKFSAATVAKYGNTILIGFLG
jgi:hypothetical protein